MAGERLATRYCRGSAATVTTTWALSIVTHTDSTTTAPERLFCTVTASADTALSCSTPLNA